jgi:hypothetical protein
MMKQRLSPILQLTEQQEIFFDNLFDKSLSASINDKIKILSIIKKELVKIINIETIEALNKINFKNILPNYLPDKLSYAKSRNQMYPIFTQEELNSANLSYVLKYIDDHPELEKNMSTNIGDLGQQQEGINLRAENIKEERKRMMREKIEQEIREEGLGPNETINIEDLGHEQEGIDLRSESQLEAQLKAKKKIKKNKAKVIHRSELKKRDDKAKSNTKYTSTFFS